MAINHIVRKKGASDVDSDIQMCWWLTAFLEDLRPWYSIRILPYCFPQAAVLYHLLGSCPDPLLEQVTFLVYFSENKLSWLA